MCLIPIKKISIVETYFEKFHNPRTRAHEIMKSPRQWDAGFS